MNNKTLAGRTLVGDVFYVFIVSDEYDTVVVIKGANTYDQARAKVEEAYPDSYVNDVQLSTKKDITELM